MKPQIWTPGEIVNRARDVLRARGKKEAHLVAGRYGDILAGWEAQARLNRDRLTDEAMQARLPLASGEGLRDLGRSEYWAEFDETPGKAIGEIVLQRVLVNTSSGTVGTFTLGTLPEGLRFRKVGNQDASPKVQEASYVSRTSITINGNDSLVPVDLGGGRFQHTQNVTVPVVATETGAAANTQIFANESQAQFSLSDNVFDPLFKAVFGLVAGGFASFSDDTIRLLAQKNYIGQFGPVDGALIAGTLARFGTEHAAIWNDRTNAIAHIFPTDASWGASASFSQAVDQVIKDTRRGFGCRTSVGIVINRRITVAATAVLDSASSLGDTSDITAAVQKKLRSYFDDRPDWYTWRTDAVAGVISTAHRKVIACPSATVKDLAGVPFAEPSPLPFVVFGGIFHWYLADNAVSMTYAAPS